MTDSILKVLQHDSLSYAYTFKIGTNNSEPVFENLILKSVTGGYIGFILRYEPTNGLTDLSKFTGKIKRFDLEENLLTERSFENGILVNQQSSNARVGSGPSLLCLADINLTLVCADELGPSETTGLPRDYMCLEWVWVVEYTYEPCPSGGSGGGGGSDDGGTYLPFPGGGGGGGLGGGTGSGGGSGGGSTGGGTGSSNPDFEGGGDEEIGVLPPDIVEQRTAEIKELVEEDPFVLIEIPCDQLPKWQALAQHVPPQSVIDKIEDLKENHDGLFGDWDIQYLDEAEGIVVNMDYWPVTVTTMPKKPDGSVYTPGEFLQFFRENINDFIDEERFGPYDHLGLGEQESNLWNSSNPVGAIVNINIDPNDGVVVCSENVDQYWRFMTLEAPLEWSHPVSGTREFGYERNRNGSYTFYTRGVDRFTSGLQELIAAFQQYYGNNYETDPFAKADDFWSNLQDGIMREVQEKGGVATAQPIVKARVNYEEIMDVLKGRKPISDLGCN